MDVNREAPAIARAEVVIAAEPETVWEILAAFEEWPSWNPDVSSVTLEGGLAKGSVFRWKAGRSKITSRLVEVERPRLLGWTGKTAGIKAVHVWQLSPRDGGTLARTEESWEGLPVRILHGLLQKNLQKAMDDGLGYLKAEAERRAQSRG
jgi:uncharacterized protein YndB with AHSA1/START domain